ncbi:MAG TPA: hypothetical protein VKC59_01490, partial [Candidatus Limnocylindrales bacterium]|nr:hypothetical protein [Candidatus Limnocylindrales bacterium]
AANSERDVNGAGNGNGHAAARPGVLDLSSVTPGVRGETAYDRAVREALARERPAKAPVKAKAAVGAAKPKR